MKTIREELSEKKVLVSDGAWGTFLSAKGLQPGECPELWNLERREDVMDVARSYAEAGADMVSTNTFGGTRFKLAHYGLAERAGELNEAGAAATREAVGADVRIFASVGPTGKILMMGDVSEEELYEGFKEQLTALERGGADACCVETMAALDEAMIAIQAARENTGLEVMCTFTFDTMGDGSFRTMMGVSPAEMAQAAVEAGAVAIGANCGQGPEGMVGIVKELRAAAPDTPILVQPNAGLPVLVDGVNTFPATPEMMAGYVPGLVEAGASIVGGCCGTMPEHLQAISEAVQSLR